MYIVRVEISKKTYLETEGVLAVGWALYIKTECTRSILIWAPSCNASTVTQPNQSQPSPTGEERLLDNYRITWAQTNHKNRNYSLRPIIQECF